MAVRTVLEVEGLDETRRALRGISPAAAKGLRLALNEAADLLIDTAKPKIPSRSGTARSSLKARSTQNKVRIAVGGRRAPYYPWLDFGGKVGRRKSVERAFYSDGRYLYPTLYQIRPDLQELIDRRVREIARDAGLEVD